MSLLCKVRWSKNWQNLKYLIAHKYYVFKAGLRLKVPLWQLIIHDWSKFGRYEWSAYADYFYYKDKLDSNSKEWKVIKDNFNKAWAHHWALNKHHWEYWVNCHGKACHKMPYKYIKEMVADWIGAGYAKTGKVEVLQWYQENKDRIKLNKWSRFYLETVLKDWHKRYPGDKL